MGDSEEKPRPNAGYKLSRDNQDGITWHYNREHRLANAPQLVQDMYRERKPQRPGIKSFLSSKPGAVTFISIILICIMAFITSFVFSKGNTHSLDGNRLAIQAEKYEGMVLVTLEKKSEGFQSRVRPAYIGAVDITVLPVSQTDTGQPDQPANMFNHTIMFTRESPKHFAFTVPFESDELVLVLKTGKKTLGITVKVE